jgi:hypothetical protein
MMAARRRLTWQEKVLLVLEIILVIGSAYGGIGLMADRANGLGMGTSVFRYHVFPDFLIPGITLFVANCLFPLAVTISTWMRLRWAVFGHIAIGLILLGWMVVETVLIQFSFLQPSFLVLGLLALGLGISNHRALARRRAAGFPTR